MTDTTQSRQAAPSHQDYAPVAGEIRFVREVGTIIEIPKGVTIPTFPSRNAEQFPATPVFARAAKRRRTGEQTKFGIVKTSHGGSIRLFMHPEHAIGPRKLKIVWSALNCVKLEVVTE